MEASSVTETCVADLHAYFNTDNVARALSAALLLLLDTWLSEHRCWSPVAVSCSKALLTSRKVSACPRTSQIHAVKPSGLPPAKRERYGGGCCHMPRNYESGLGWVTPHLSVSPPMAPHPLTLLRGSSPSRKGPSIISLAEAK